MSRTNFHGPKDVQAIEVRLYCDILFAFLNMYASSERGSTLKANNFLPSSKLFFKVGPYSVGRHKQTILLHCLPLMRLVSIALDLLPFNLLGFKSSSGRLQNMFSRFIPKEKN